MMPNNSKVKPIYRIASLTLYLLTVAISSILLWVEPNGFDARALILPLVIILFLSSLGVSQKIISKSQKGKVSPALGTVALSILLTFIGFLIVATVAWLIALSHAQSLSI